MSSAVVKNTIPTDSSTFDEMESNVQSYARSFPVVMERAEGCYLETATGKRYLDFLAGAGSLNYGHNNPKLRARLIDYIDSCGITHSLDMHTASKKAFLDAFNELILKPRGLDYVVQFTGPTGTNAVEAALKLARMVTGRQNIIAFTNGFHGVSLGALAATGNEHHRGSAGIALPNVTRMPFDDYFGSDVDTIDYLEQLLDDNSSGIDLPAAAIVETVQGEGGLNVASSEWLARLQTVCHERGILLIVDDIQAGCGRTGSFFSFEEAGLEPDIVTLSKSLSGYGLPFAVTIFKRELDRWQPGEHNGTFRGNNHAFVTATAALENYWQDDEFARHIAAMGEILRTRLEEIAARHADANVHARGRGLMRGLAFDSGDTATAVARRAFEHALVIETSGSEGEVLKCLPPLTISEKELRLGLEIIEASVDAVLGEKARKGLRGVS